MKPRMSAMAKWIGGATALVALLLGAAVYAGRSVEAQANDPEQWLKDDIVVTQAPAPKPSPAAVVRPANEPFVIKRILKIDGPIKYGEWHWEDAGVPDGPIVVTV